MESNSNAVSVTKIDDLPRRKSEHYRDFYANACNVRLSPYDFVITFLQNKEIAGEIFVEELAAATLSPQQFKALVVVASNTLKAYESNFGELQLPATFVPRMDMEEKLREAITSHAATSSSEPRRPSARSRAASRKKGG